MAHRKRKPTKAQLAARFKPKARPTNDSDVTHTISRSRQTNHTLSSTERAAVEGFAIAEGAVAGPSRGLSHEEQQQYSNHENQPQTIVPAPSSSPIEQLAQAPAPPGRVRTGLTAASGVINSLRRLPERRLFNLMNGSLRRSLVPAPTREFSWTLTAFIATSALGYVTAGQVVNCTGIPNMTLGYYLDLRSICLYGADLAQNTGLGSDVMRRLVSYFSRLNIASLDRVLDAVAEAGLNTDRVMVRGADIERWTTGIPTLFTANPGSNERNVLTDINTQMIPGAFNQPSGSGTAQGPTFNGQRDQQAGDIIQDLRRVLGAQNMISVYEYLNENAVSVARAGIAALLAVVGIYTLIQKIWDGDKQHWRNIREINIGENEADTLRGLIIGERDRGAGTQYQIFWQDGTVLWTHIDDSTDRIITNVDLGIPGMRGKFLLRRQGGWET